MAPGRDPVRMGGIFSSISMVYETGGGCQMYQNDQMELGGLGVSCEDSIETCKWPFYIAASYPWIK